MDTRGTKTAKAIRLMDSGKTKEALRIAKDFRLGLTKPLQVKLARAYECLVRPEFYESLGFNPCQVVRDGKAVFYQYVAFKSDPNA